MTSDTRIAVSAWKTAARLVHISDSHIGPDPGFELHGVNVCRRLTELCQHLNMLHARGVPIDAVVHTGDLVADGDSETSDERSLQLALSLLATLPAPVLLINGNHDNLDALADASHHRAVHPKILRPETKLQDSLAGVIDLPSVPWLRLFAVDARSTPDIDPQGFVSDEQLAHLEDVLQSCHQSAQRCLVYLHYPALPLDCQWLDNGMLITNGSQLHQLLKRYADTVACVLFGHIHQGLQHLVDGVLYSSVGALACQFSSWPNDSEPGFDVVSPGFFNYITVSPQALMIRQLTVHARGVNNDGV
ncbi:MAG: metallophosphoesterase [Gammaproteobacteria bacterium]|nr:metallophosphoesterase [Gammaproteobacteria bacterium]